jgi:phage terminase large subunit
MYPDPAGNQRRTSAGGRTDITIMQNAGFRVLARHRHPAVKDRINAVNSLLCSQAGDRRLTIDPRCRNVIQSLSRQTYKQGTQIPDDGDLSHMADAVGYMVEYLFPVVRNINNTNKAQTTWKVYTE